MTTTEPTTIVEPTMVTAGELRPGDVIFRDGQPREVRHVEAYSMSSAPGAPVDWVVAVCAGGYLMDSHVDAPVPLVSRAADGPAYDRYATTPVQIAAALRRAAADLEAMGDVDLSPVWVSLNLQAIKEGDTEVNRVATVDRLAQALIGAPAQYVARTSQHATVYKDEDARGDVTVQVYTGLDRPNGCPVHVEPRPDDCAPCRESAPFAWAPLGAIWYADPLPGWLRLTAFGAVVLIGVAAITRRATDA